MSDEVETKWEQVISGCTQIKADGYFTAKNPNGELVLLFYNLEAQVCMTCPLDLQILNDFMDREKVKP